MVKDNGIAGPAGRGIFGMVLVFLLPALLAGCLQLERTVQVNRDGSGVLIERLVMSNEIIEMAAGMQPEGKPFSPRNDEELSGKAAQYGEAVRFLSAKDVETPFGKGYEARYAFDDINGLRMGQDVKDSMPMPGGGDGDGKEPKFTTFTMRGENPAELLIHWPLDEAEDSQAEDTEQEPLAPEDEQMAMEMMKAMFDGMRMATHVEVMGDIVETNATHRSGSRVTLLDIDFGAMLADEGVLKAMAGDKPETMADLKKFMEMFPGLKLETEPEVTIRFQ